MQQLKKYVIITLFIDAAKMAARRTDAAVAPIAGNRKPGTTPPD